MDSDQWALRWFERANTPSIIFDNTLAVLIINASARAYLNSSIDISLSNARMTFSRRDAHTCFKAFLTALTEHDSRSMFIGQTLVTGTRLGNGGPHGINIRSTDHNSLIACADLSTLGITTAEQNVLLHIVNGKSPAQIANDLNNSLQTIRTHTKRRYAKLDVSTKKQLFERSMPYLSTSRRTW